jgi:UDP-N-acetylglucosamine pyrophosphorylase
MKPTCFDVFEYIMDEICNIAANPTRSCGFAPYIQFMIETVAHEKSYKDVKHEPLHLAVPKDPRTHRTTSPPPVVAPSCSTHSDGASSSSAQGSLMLKMFRGIFTKCRRSDE